MRRITLAAGLCLLLVGSVWTFREPSVSALTASQKPAAQGEKSELKGDGVADDTAAIQKLVDSGQGDITFPKGVYKLTEPVVIDLERVGYTSLHGSGVAQFVMEGPGPAFRFVGTHGGTASPPTVADNVWQNQRTPLVDGIEIVGRHPEASGLEVTGTMQFTATRVVVREALHGIRLTGRNRNVILSECHFYHNRGMGVFLHDLNLHQINIANCHISYNAQGGIVSRNSEIRNLQIGVCDIESNMAEATADQPGIASANVELDASGSSLGEVAIIGCTLQHTKKGANSANVRINGFSREVKFTPERRHGNITIADNIMSDVTVNVELRHLRSVTLTGNTIWEGHEYNLLIDDCAQFVIANNVFDRNPRYHYGAAANSGSATVFQNCSDGILNGNHWYGEGRGAAAVHLKDCQRINLTNCSILDYGACGLLLEQVVHSRVSDCLIREDRPDVASVSLKIQDSSENQIIDNLLSHPAPQE